MTVVQDRWQSYWADKTTPQYARETDEHYREYARELRLLFPDPTGDRVLEIGCGNGALFRHLGFDRCDRYLGVDFSARMLSTFSESFPRVDTVCADGAGYRSDEEYDLIFSSQVAQYWNRCQLADHLDNALGMLAPTGLIVVSGIPWARMRFPYARGDMTGGRRRPWPRTALGFANELVRKPLGHWYDHPELHQLAATRGLHADFFGSIHYPYRFHAVLRRRRLPAAARFSQRADLGGETSAVRA